MIRKGQKLQPTFVRARKGGYTHAVENREPLHLPARTLCAQTIHEITFKRFQADMVTQLICPVCTEHADHLRRGIYKERERARKRETP